MKYGALKYPERFIIKNIRGKLPSTIKIFTETSLLKFAKYDKKNFFKPGASSALFLLIPLPSFSKLKIRKRFSFLLFLSTEMLHKLKLRIYNTIKKE